MTHTVNFSGGLLGSIVHTFSKTCHSGGIELFDKYTFLSFTSSLKVWPCVNRAVLWSM